MPLPVRRSALAIAGLLALTSSAQAVIRHPVDDPTALPGPTNLSAVVGRWDVNASAVAVGPNHILTTRHQGGGVGTTVVFNGNSYEVAQETLVGAADLRIARITTVGGGSDANLLDFTSVFSGSDTAPLNFTMAGYGRGRGADLTTTGGTYGYAWNADGNTNLRAGRNVIDGSDLADDSGTGGFVSDVLFADFDGPGRPTSITGEAILTEFDSGGAWFVENGPGNWQLAALSRAVGHIDANADNPNTPGLPADPQAANQALFASFQDASVNAPDYLDGVRLSTYRTFINANIPEPGTTALLTAMGLLTAMRRRR